MVLTPRKKIITARFRQRGNIVSFLDPSPGPPPPPPAQNASAYGATEDELASNPGGAGSFRFGAFWKPDGTRIFTCRGLNFEIFQNDVSPSWDIQNVWTNLVTTANFSNIRSIWWSPDGTVLSICTRLPSSAFTITTKDQSATPFDVAVLGASKSINIGVTSGGPGDHVWSADGLRMFINYQSGVPDIREYAATTPFDPTTLGTVAVAIFSVFPDAGTGMRTFAFSTDGTVVYAMVLQVLVSWDLSIPFDITTMANFTTGPTVPSSLGIPRGIFVRPDNPDIFIEGDQNQLQVAWFRLPPPPPPPAQDATAFGLDELQSDPESSSGIIRQHVYWKRDGTKVWTAKLGNQIRQSDVSPAWGIVPGDWSFDVGTGAIADLRSVWWSPDGTKLSICTRFPSAFFRITVHDQSATPHDLTVLGASTNKAFSPGAAGGPQDHAWSTNGLKMWVHYPSNFLVQGLSVLLEYTATLAFDPTTLTPTNGVAAFFDFAPDAGLDLHTFAFSTDGTKIYGMDGQFLVSWDLSPAFDITSAGNFQTGPTVAAASLSIPKGLNVRPDNGDIYIAGDQGVDRRMAWFRI